MNNKEKEILNKLIKIADGQQKIIKNQQSMIKKLAQQTGTELSAEHLDPNKAEKQSARALFNALPVQTKAAIVNIEEHGQDMLVGFKEGQKTQANYDVVLRTLQDLTTKNIIQHKFNLKAV